MASKPVSFIVHGQAEGPEHTGEVLTINGVRRTIKSAVNLSARRSSGDSVRVMATPGEDVVILQLADGPTLTLHPEHARDLFLAHCRASARGNHGEEKEVRVGPHLSWPNPMAGTQPGRQHVAGALLTRLQVMTPGKAASDSPLSLDQLVSMVDGQVDPGVYALQPDALGALKGSATKLTRVPQAPDQGPLLVLIHGTFVDTVTTFGRLWTQHPQRVRGLFARYTGRVYALEHPTLAHSPFGNALTLVRALPDGARLHLLAHSRGGLVAEILARLAGSNQSEEVVLRGFPGPARAQQRSEISELSRLLREKGIRVDRVVRVACPARGTSFASGRLDAYLSVLRWSLELSGNQPLPAIDDFLEAVARERADPRRLPGLEAQMRDGPLVEWLNTADGIVQGDLRVVAADPSGDDIIAWVKTLMSDAACWSDSDLVVQTRSMYGGSPRQGGASYFVDHGTKSTHFAYFETTRGVDAVLGALTQDRPAGFKLIGPLSWAAKAIVERQPAHSVDDDGRPARDKPAVFLLPGLFGTHLSVDDERVWLGPYLAGGFRRLAYDPSGADRVAPDGLVGQVYDDLIEFLSATHEVTPFAYDWRQPIEDVAGRLAVAIDAALSLRAATLQPVRIVAHSTGGLVARALEFVRPDVWARLMNRPGARLLMIGTPQAGSWRPLQLLSGDDTLAGVLTAASVPGQARVTRQVLATMPGVLQCQAGLTDKTSLLARSSDWAQLADADLGALRELCWWHQPDLQAEESGWGVPSQDVLDRALALRHMLDLQADSRLAQFADKVLIVAGASKPTTVGFERTEGGISYVVDPEGGDGEVPLSSAMIDGVRTWVLDAENSRLPSLATEFDAYLELLTDGDTVRLRAVSGAERAAPASSLPTALTRNRPVRTRSASVPPQAITTVFESPGVWKHGGGLQHRALRPLKVVVVNGNLSFVREPLIVGHYRSLGLSGTERVLDGLLAGAMSASLGLGVYPDAPGSHLIFENTVTDPENPWRGAWPPSVVVVGLGEEGTLRDQDLVLTVRQGVLGWMRQAVENGEALHRRVTLAATLIGSGASGIAPGRAAQAIAQGVRQANARLAEGGWPIVAEVLLIEVFLERATEALAALRVLDASQTGAFEIPSKIRPGTAAISRQLDMRYRGADYDFITALAGGEEGAITYTVDSKRARTQVRALVTQGALLREIVARTSSENQDDPQIGKTLFQLLIPPEMDSFLGGSSRVLLELDPTTACVPWEALDTPEARRTGDDMRPWAIRSQLLRKLRLSSFRQEVHDAIADDNALVVGEPEVDRTYPDLPGARAEAEAVSAQLSSAHGLGPERVVTLIGSDASTVVNQLLARSYRILHIAGHGEPGSAGGVVMSGHTFLGPREISMMRTVPEFVFVNCCHLAARDLKRTSVSVDRVQFAAGVADALIAIGVRCVVAAGWAVEDEGATIFATTFYRQLLNGSPFVTAVSVAREATWREGQAGNTWAAYQCYGDPNWSLRPPSFVQAQRDDYAGISSPPALTMALNELASGVQYLGLSRGAALERVRHLEARFGMEWGGMGALAEAFGVAYGECGEYEEAIAWYERALRCSDASASMRASEQLGNLRARLALQDAAGALPGTPEFEKGRARVLEALRLLESLTSLQPTVERHCLCGSAMKRLAMIEAHAGDQRASLTWFGRSAERYRAAEQLARDLRDPSIHYPGLNRMVLELIVGLGDDNWPGFDREATAILRRSLGTSVRDNPSFWSLVAIVELDTYEAIAAKSLARAVDALIVRFKDLNTRMNSRRMWCSVADQMALVLGSYASVARSDESKAIKALLAMFEGFLGESPSLVEFGDPKRQRQAARRRVPRKSKTK